MLDIVGHWEMQIKTIIRYHPTPTGWLQAERPDNEGCGETGAFLYWWGECKTMFGKQSVSSSKT